MIDKIRRDRICLLTFARIPLSLKSRSRELIPYRQIISLLVYEMES
jgi:hypothetical protein